MAVKKILTKDDLERKLQQQIDFIQMSAEQFDAGHEDEAVRLAVSIRILVHQTKSSHSLLDQLGMKNKKFVDSSFNFNINNKFPHSGLVVIETGLEAKFLPPLDMPGRTFSKLDFDKWWEKVVFKDTKGNTYKRRDLILTAANQDGGAHVDPGLDEIYQGLLKENTHGWEWNSQGVGKVIGSPVYPSIRQIAHEVLKTLVDNYSKEQTYKGAMVVGGLSMSEGVPDWVKDMDAKGKKKILRNSPCFCDSGKKYKKCCYLLK